MESLTAIFLLIVLVFSVNVSSLSAAEHPGRAERVDMSVLSDPGLPDDFDYEAGYKIYRLDDGRHVAYIALGEGEGGTDPVRRVRARREGWFEDFGLQGTACLCGGGGGSPELRTNDINNIPQYIFFRYTVPPAVPFPLNATLFMHCCDKGNGNGLDVYCHESVVLGPVGLGMNYLTGCDGFNDLPDCTPTAPSPTYDLMGFQDMTVVTDEGVWYTWDVTLAAQGWANNAPTIGYLMLFGDGGVGGLEKRFSSSCNNPLPALRPFLRVVF